MDKNTVRRVSVRYSSFGAESESGSKPVKCLVKGKTRAGDGYDGENRPAAPAPLAPGGQEIEPCPTDANISEGKLRSIIIGSDVADCASWRLVATCRGCCTCRTRVSDCGKCPARAVPVSCLPAGVTFATVLHRLRCARCRSQADRVLLDNQAPDWQRRIIRRWGRGTPP